MSASPRAVIEMQANEHPLEYSDRFESMEEYCLFLMHLRAYEEAAQRSQGLNVLDFGCNNGYGTNLIAGWAASVFGCDVSETALADARRRFPTIEFCRIDGFSLPFADDQFDLITSFQVIEHIADTASYLAEIKRVLRPGGTALLTTPNAAIRLDPGMRPWNRFHVREYRARELHQVLQGAFVRVDIRGLFAAEELYQIEYGRCQKALALHRNPPPRARRGLANRFAGVAKAMLPATAVHALRRVRGGSLSGARGRVFDAPLLKRFSTRDLRYASTDLDSALDLMAICACG